MVAKSKASGKAGGGGGRSKVVVANKHNFEEKFRGVSMSEYHDLSSQLSDCIGQLRRYHQIISAEQAESLRAIILEVDGVVEFDIDEVSKQYQLFLHMQKQLITDKGDILAGADIRDISSVLSAMTSLISLFLKANKEIDSIKEEAKLKAAVLRAVSGLDDKARASFFEVLENG